MHFAFIDDFIRQRNVIVPEQPGIACKYGPSVDHSLYAPSGQHAELTGWKQGFVGFFFITADHSFPEGML